MNRRTTLMLLLLLFGGVLVILGLFLQQYLQPKASIEILTGIPTRGVQEDQVIPQLELREIVSGLIVPWEIVFPETNKMYVTERGGRVRVVLDGQLLPDPILTIPEVSTQAEEGLMGMTLDPGYATNKLLYLAYAYPQNGNIRVKVVQYQDLEDRFEQRAVIIDNIPAARFHAGTRIAFGPDEKLYITTGDASQKEIAQDLESLGGKILRLNADGTIPADNPFPNSPIWSYGHRNSQGISWNPETGAMYASEHGPSVFDGPPGGDEINLIEPGMNYGWPIVSHDESNPDMISPIVQYTPAIAPGGILWYSGELFPQFQNTILIAGLIGEGVYWLTIDESNPSQFIETGMLEFEIGRVRTITQGVDGSIYLLTSNEDGRGDSTPEQDKIYQIVAQ